MLLGVIVHNFADGANGGHIPAREELLKGLREGHQSSSGELGIVLGGLGSGRPLQQPSFEDIQGFLLPALLILRLLAVELGF